MTERYFLYIDILGFKELIQDSGIVEELYDIIDSLNVHRDKDFTTIVFSDTIVVYGSDIWNGAPDQVLMWLTEFAQDLHYRLIAKDIHFRAFITRGDFYHYKLKNLDAYFGQALVKCYEKDKGVKCTGLFMDADLAPWSRIFKTSRYDQDVYFVHMMQHLDSISWPYESYPVSGEYLESTGMETWVVYLLYYVKNVYLHMNNSELSDGVREKYKNTWRMLSEIHDGLLRRLQECDFRFDEVIQLDWEPHLRNIGTEEGAWG